MDCHSVRSLLTLMRREPGQLDASEREALERHLENCPGCLAWDRGDRHVDSALATAMRNVTTPIGLERRIHERLAAARPWRPGRWAAAAGVLLAVGIATLILWPRAEAVDLPGFVVLLMNDNEPSLADRAEAHFAKVGTKVKRPDDLDDRFLAHFELAPFQGQQVPRLTYRAEPGDRAERNEPNLVNVYVLPLDRFRVPEEVEGKDESTSSGQHVMARTDRQNQVIYIYEWKGDALRAVSVNRVRL
jgi:hypothetical protein